MGEAGLAPFAELLSVFFKKDPEFLRQIEENKALEAWPGYVGEAAARVSKAIRLRNGTLTVHVQDGIWMQQLSLLKNGILSRYRNEFPKIVIRDIFFKRQALAR
ncbi:DUF721 domain-containing protein [bacterium]|nr:DUF721 domain-containing protein [bacterium]